MNFFDFLDERKQILWADNEDETTSHTAKVFLRIKGMTCASCVSLIEKALGKKRGIQSVLVGLLAQKGEVKYDPTQISPEQIAAEITVIGYEADVIGGDDENAEVDLLVGIKQAEVVCSSKSGANTH